jgi:hypothetical protein
MSGGYFDYNQYRLNDISDEIDRLVSKNNSTLENEWGECEGAFVSDNTIEKFKEISMLLKKCSAMVQRIDWLICGDDSEESFEERWEKEVEEIYNLE